MYTTLWWRNSVFFWLRNLFLFVWTRTRRYFALLFATWLLRIILRSRIRFWLLRLTGTFYKALFRLKFLIWRILLNSVISIFSKFWIFLTFFIFLSSFLFIFHLFLTSNFPIIFFQILTWLHYFVTIESNFKKIKPLKNQNSNR